MADQKTLESLFEALVGEMQDRLENGDEQLVKTEEGVQPYRVRASAATLNTIARFLKDQNVTADSSKNDGLQKLSSLLAEASKNLPPREGDDLLN